MHLGAIKEAEWVQR